VLDRRGQHLREGPELALRLAFLGEAEQGALGGLDLLAAALLRRAVESLVDHLLADADQAALERQVVDDVAVLDRVDDGLGGVREPAQVAGAIQLA
jgi:hypothetical protein